RRGTCLSRLPATPLAVIRLVRSVPASIHLDITAPFLDFVWPDARRLAGGNTGGPCLCVRRLATWAPYWLRGGPWRDQRSPRCPRAGSGSMGAVVVRGRGLSG